MVKKDEQCKRFVTLLTKTYIIFGLFASTMFEQATERGHSHFCVQNPLTPFLIRSSGATTVSSLPINHILD